MNAIYVLIPVGLFLGASIILIFSLAQKISELIISDELLVSRLFVLAIVFVFFMLIELMLFSYIKSNVMDTVLIEGINKKIFIISIFMGIFLCLSLPNIERKLKAVSWSNVDWKDAVINSAQGENNGVEVIIKNIPCLESNNKRKYPYSNFGRDFIHLLLYEKISNYEQDVLKNNGKVNCFVDLSHYSPIEVNINAGSVGSEKEFYFNVSEAIVKAFKGVSFKR